jgi:hypothetical protein
MVTQRPGVIPASVAGVNSMTLVDSEKATDAAPFGELTSILMPDTDAIEPPTSSSPSALTGVSDAGAATDVVVDADADSLDELLVEDPHATVDNAVIPTIASTENCAADVFCMLAPERRW